MGSGYLTRHVIVGASLIVIWGRRPLLRIRCRIRDRDLGRGPSHPLTISTIQSSAEGRCRHHHPIRARRRRRCRRLRSVPSRL